VGAKSSEAVRQVGHVEHHSPELLFEGDVLDVAQYLLRKTDQSFLNTHLIMISYLII